MIDGSRLKQMYRDIALTKAYNNRFVELKAQGKVSGPIHQTEGQEAVGVGVCSALEQSDYVVNYYRGYAEWICRGTDLKKLAAEFLGKRAGLCQGKGGEMTLADPASGVINSSGIIGGSIPLGVGVAWAAKRHGKGQVAAVFFGDGAVNTGAFHEALNMAAMLKAPAVLVCLNNQYAISTYSGDVMAGNSIAARAVAYGMPGQQVDGNDVVAVYEAALQAVQRARKGEGPSLIEGLTFRIGGHSSTYPESERFMDAEKLRHYKARDPLHLLRQRLLEDGVAGEEELREVERHVERIAEEAVAFGLEAPYPDSEAAAQGVFV